MLIVAGSLLVCCFGGVFVVDFRLSFFDLVGGLVIGGVCWYGWWLLFSGVCGFGLG